MNNTPRVDRCQTRLHGENDLGWWVTADMARHLERELATMTEVAKRAALECSQLRGQLAAAKLLLNKADVSWIDVPGN